MLAGPKSAGYRIELSWDGKTPVKMTDLTDTQGKGTAHDFCQVQMDVEGGPTLTQLENPHLDSGVPFRSC